MKVVSVSPEIWRNHTGLVLSPERTSYLEVLTYALPTLRRASPDIVHGFVLANGPKEEADDAYVAAPRLTLAGQTYKLLFHFI